MHDFILLKDIFINSCQKYPNKLAVVINNKNATYKELYHDVQKFMHYLERNKFKAGDRVVIQSANTYPLIVMYWAVQLMGGVVSLFPFDCNAGVLNQMLDDLDPALVIGYNLSDEQKQSVNLISNNFVKIFFNSEDEFDSCLSNVVFANDMLPSNNIISSDLAMIIYTSGTTGDAKGVMLSHDNMLNAIKSINGYLKLRDSDIVYSILPMHFDYGLYQMLLSVYVGATLILEHGMIFPGVFFRAIEKYQVTVLPILPNIISLILKYNKSDELKFRTVRKITNTGERLSVSHIEFLKTIFPDAAIYLMYGLTECKRCSYVSPDMLDKKPGSIGIPMPNLAMAIVDENGKHLPANAVGEIVISTPTLMRGYWKNINLTNKKIKLDAQGRRVLYSGDIGYQDNDGYFFLSGRNDSLVKLNGEKCHLGNYAARLESQQDIVRAYLFLRTISDEDKQLIACIEIQSQSKCDASYLQKLKSCFPVNHQPAYFYIAESFPVLPNGKLCYQKLESIAINAFTKTLNLSVQ